MGWTTYSVCVVCVYGSCLVFEGVVCVLGLVSV